MSKVHSINPTHPIPQSPPQHGIHLRKWTKFVSINVGKRITVCYALKGETRKGDRGSREVVAKEILARNGLKLITRNKKNVDEIKSHGNLTYWRNLGYLAS